MKAYSRSYMDKSNKTFFQTKLQRLEKIAQESQKALELCVSFGDYQTALTKFKNRKDIFERAVQGLRQVVPIAFYAFFTIDELEFDISLEHCDAKEKEPYIVDNVDYLIENGSVSLAFWENRTLTATSKDRRHNVLIHALATTSKMYGMFFCFLEKKSFEPNIADKITTIVIKSTCYALENFELYRLIDRKNVELTEKNNRLSKEIQKKKDFEEKLRYQALHDPLTNLPNRKLLQDRLNLAILKTHRNSKSKYGVVFIDIDRFKKINDTLGHNVGDLVLVKVAQKIKNCVRKVDTVARFGGDEFVVILENVKKYSFCEFVSQRILREFQKPMRVDGRELYITISMGIFCSGDGSLKDADAIRLADISMFEAKRKGRNTVVFFHEIADKEIEKKLVLENQLQQAIKKDQFFVQYQPLIDLQNDRLYGLEALVRWNHPELGILLPGSFIPIAEETGLIVPLGRKIFQIAFNDFAKWLFHNSRARDLLLTINLSVKQLFHGDLIENVRQAAIEAKLPLKNVNLEITESVFIDDVEYVKKTIEMLKQMGVSISIDDFGTGYCSLRYLNHFSIDLVKIDKSLIKNIASDATNMNIVESMLKLCDRMKLNALAEGIENVEQLNKLRKMNCRFGQGFYFFPPQEKNAMERIITQATKRGGILTLKRDFKVDSTYKGPRNELNNRQPKAGGF